MLRDVTRDAEAEHNEQGKAKDEASISSEATVFSK
jgi:hypothetical protein